MYYKLLVVYSKMFKFDFNSGMYCNCFTLKGTFGESREMLILILYCFYLINVFVYISCMHIKYRCA